MPPFYTSTIITSSKNTGTCVERERSDLKRHKQIFYPQWNTENISNVYAEKMKHLKKTHVEFDGVGIVGMHVMVINVFLTVCAAYILNALE